MTHWWKIVLRTGASLETSVTVTHLTSDKVICFTGEAHLLATEAGTDWVRAPVVLFELDGAGDGLLSRLIASGAGDWLRLNPGAGDALRRWLTDPDFTTLGDELEETEECLVLDIETFEAEFLDTTALCPDFEKLGALELVPGDVMLESGWE